MSLTDAIASLLEQRSASTDESLEESNLKPGAGAKESKPAKQGSSKDASWESLGGDKGGETGTAASSKMSETSKKPTGKGAGKAHGYTTKEDPTKEINKSSSKGNVFQESIAKLFEGDKTLTEEFKTKATGLFEALVDARVAELREEIEAEAAEAAVAEIEKKEIELTEQVDKYLDYIAEKWLEDHQPAVEAALKAEMAESFFNGLRTLFAEHYITFPEGGTDVVSALETENAELKDELNATIEAGVEVEEELTVLKKQAIIAENAQGLALTEQEKLVTLCADAIFEDEEKFAEKVAVIRESYFPSKKSKPLTEEKSAEVIDSNDDKSSDDEEVEIDPSMAAIVSALNKTPRF